MARYFFDLRDEDDIAFDEEGLELKDIRAVQDEAARSLADMGRDEVRRHAGDPNKRRRMAIEVRDDNGPVLEVKFAFEISKHK
jgi:uncharacterized protein DUF6894